MSSQINSANGLSSSRASPVALGEGVTLMSLGVKMGTAVDSYYVPTDRKRWQHLYVLPVLLLEFLALSLTRAVLPSILLQQYGNRVYLVLGCADCVRGLLAFFACPLFGRISDIIGRRACLLITVIGTCAPVCSLALFSWEAPEGTTAITDPPNDATNQNATAFSALGEDSKRGSPWQTLDQSGEPPLGTATIHEGAMTTFVILLAVSGVFSSTFTLVFAYISDTVRQQDERVSAYGLALATFGLSYTIGPIAGGYLARTSAQRVFLCSLVFTIIDLLYIYFLLPESKEGVEVGALASTTTSLISMDHKFAWSPASILRIMAIDPFLQNMARVVFLYYTGLWAVISTLSVYAVKRFQLGPERLGELMSALGLCTMVAEAVLVRILVPMLGEKQSMRLGLLAFLLQCVVLGLAYEGWHLFLCTGFSLFANLVYPSLSSLVTGSVEPDAVGEALGAMNGVKALTEGVGPLVFGSLMTISERSTLPGWPYLLAALLAYLAYKSAGELPDEDDEYVHELDQKRPKHTSGIIMQHVVNSMPNQECATAVRHKNEGDEYQGLLSEVDESSDLDDSDGNDVRKLPPTFPCILR